jgi:hypothetical protein
MKCIRCGTDSKLKERRASQGRCRRCQHPFAFEPTTMGITDVFFAKAIADISLNNTVFFTPQHLLYFLDKRKRSKAVGGIFSIIFSLLFFMGIVGIFVVGIFRLPLPIYLTLWTILSILLFGSESTSQSTDDRTRRLNATLLQILAVIILIVGLPWSVAFNSILGYIVTAILAITSVWLGFVKKRQQVDIVNAPVVTPSQAKRWLDRWSEINGVPVTLLAKTPKALVPTPIHPEVSAYSFDRLVVCDSPEIVHTLISNNFHFEYNCAILSINGYPENIFDTTMEMLRRNPELKIYALHDCTPTGVQLVHKIRTQPGWFPQTELPIIDVGISPRQVIAAKNLAIRQTKTPVQLTPEVLQTLTPDQQQWLESGRYVELQSLTPQRLMQILTRAIATSQASLDGGIDSGGAVIFMGDDSGMGFYGAESFG